MTFLSFWCAKLPPLFPFCLFSCVLGRMASNILKMCLCLSLPSLLMVLGVFQLSMKCAASGLHHFWQETSYHQNCFFSKALILTNFKNFWFSKLTMECFGVHFFGLAWGPLSYFDLGKPQDVFWLFGTLASSNMSALLLGVKQAPESLSFLFLPPTCCLFPLTLAALAPSPSSHLSVVPSVLLLSPHRTLDFVCSFQY